MLFVKINVCSDLYVIMIHTNICHAMLIFAKVCWYISFNNSNKKHQQLKDTCAVDCFIYELFECISGCRPVKWESRVRVLPSV